MNLIIVCTNRCNLNCRYCKNVKENKYTSLVLLKKVRKKIIDKNVKQIKKIKFFGGEPLLKFKTIKIFISDLRGRYPDLAIYLTTNGTLLNKENINWFKKNKVNLVISLDGNRFTQRLNRKGKESFEKIITILPNLPKNTIFNIVIAPNNVKYLFYNFVYLYKLGIRNFNFLPAYYNQWTEKQLKEMRAMFDKVLKLIREKKINKKINIKNLDNYSEVPFFNTGLVVDCDGTVYTTDAILNQYFRPYKDYFKIETIDKFAMPKRPTNNQINKLLNRFGPKKLMVINKYLDQILNNFVFQLKKNIWVKKI